MADRDVAGALRLAGDMQKAFPENKEAELYRAWLSALAGEDVEASIKTLRELDRAKFPHPELDFALAQAYALKGDANGKQRALTHAKSMLRAHLTHRGAAELLRGSK